MALLVLLVGGQVLMAAPFPQDDSLRNVVAYAWGYDYRKLYPFSPGLPAYDPYIGYDWFFGMVSRLATPELAIRCAQVLGALAFLAAVLAPLWRLPDRAFRMAVVLAAVLATFVTHRLVGARPEVWASAWLLAAASLRPRTWLVLGALCAPLYWLTPLYACGAFLLRATWSVRLASATVAAASSSVFWWMFSEGRWLGDLRNLSGLAALRPEPIAEAQPLWRLFDQAGSWLLVGTLAAAALLQWLQRRRVTAQPAAAGEETPANPTSAWWAVALVFLCIGSVRHVLVLAPVLMLWAATIRWGAPSLGRYCALMLLALVGGVLASHQLVDTRQDRPEFSVPPASVVLTAYSRALFMVPYANPGWVRVLPSIEPGWDAPVDKELAMAVKSGALSCDQVRQRPVTHVVTRDKAELAGECFVVVERNTGWTLWAVVSR